MGGRADRAKSGPKSHKVTPRRARNAEKKAREQLAVVEYGRSIQMAHQEWRENNIAAAWPCSKARGATSRLGVALRPSPVPFRLAHAQGAHRERYRGGVGPDGTGYHRESDRLAKVWDARTGAEILNLKGHSDAIFSAAFSPDGSRVVTGSVDRTARIWDGGRERRSSNSRGTRTRSTRRRSVRTGRAW